MVGCVWEEAGFDARGREYSCDVDVCGCAQGERVVVAHGTRERWSAVSANLSLWSVCRVLSLYG
jgi:hypothetical protein